MKHLLFFIACIAINPVFSQYLQLGDSDTICQGQHVNIVGVPFDSSQIILMDDPVTLAPLADDAFSPVLPIGFDFTFYDVAYNELQIGSNGVVRFTTSTDLYCAWSIIAPMPNPQVHTNSIMLPWLDLAANSVITYQLIGDAPNRQFVVYYNYPSLYSVNTPCWSMGLVLSEADGKIEMYIKDKPATPLWNGGFAIQGIQNSTGTIAHIVPGRNHPNVWTTGDDGKRWTPNGPSSYLIEDVPFRVVVDSTFAYQWGNTLGESFPYSDTLSSVSGIDGSVGYFLGIVNNNFCSTLAIPLTDTAWIVQDIQTPVFSVVNDYCNAGIGSISMGTISGTDASYFWIDQNTSTDTLLGLTEGDYLFVYTDTNGCAFHDTITLINESSPSAVATPTTCDYSTNGTITILPDYAFFTYNWIGYPGETTNQLDNLAPGTYHCYVQSSVGCNDTVAAEVLSSDSLAFVNVLHSDQICAGTASGYYSFALANTSGFVSVTWNGASTNAQAFSGLAVGNYILHVSNAGCLHTDTITIAAATPITVSSLTTPETLGGDGAVQLTASGGNPPYTYHIGPVSTTDGFFDNLEAGSHTGIAVDQNNCQQPFSFLISSVLSVNEANGEGFSFYPNPATDRLYITTKTEYTISITDLFGKSCFEGRADGATTIDLSAFEAGMYVVVISRDNEVIRSEKMVKVN